MANFWDDPSCRLLKSDLLADLCYILAEGSTEPLEKASQA